MSSAPTFAWWPVDRVLVHEEIDPAEVETLAAEMRAQGVCREPVWIARGSGILLNGHHRFAALRRLGAVRVPAWVFDYDDDAVISLERWGPGPPVSKSEVVRRARERRPFPPKTTRHVLHVALPDHPVPISEALAATPPGPPTG